MSANGVVDLEPIYAALFALAAAAPAWTDPATGDQVSIQVASRVPRANLAQLTPGQLPALFMEQSDFEITPAVQTVMARSKYLLSVDLVVVVPCNGAAEPIGQETQIPAQALNLALTAVLSAIAPNPPGAKQTLGGLVDSVVAKGRVVCAHGLPGAGSQVSVGVLPLTVLTI